MGFEPWIVQTVAYSLQSLSYITEEDVAIQGAGNSHWESRLDEIHRTFLYRLHTSKAPYLTPNSGVVTTCTTLQKSAC